MEKRKRSRALLDGALAWGLVLMLLMHQVEGGGKLGRDKPSGGFKRELKGSGSSSGSGSGTASLSPADWPPEVLAQFEALEDYVGPHPAGVSPLGYGVISGTTNAFAIHAGQVALSLGGSAIDAAITTALTQVVLAFGCYVSFAGIALMTYYDAETNQTFSINGSWNSVINETDPMSIPGTGSSTTQPGREVMTPGFLAALEAAHQRWGKLPWSSLFEPAIYFADNGFNLTVFTWSLLQQSEALLQQSDYGRRTFFHPNGTLLGVGDLVVQPEVARLLSNVSTQGAQAYFYEGAFAQEMVETVRALGGNMSMADMESYRATVSNETLDAQYGDFTVRTTTFPTYGGVDLVEAINIVSKFNLSDHAHFTQDADALFWMLQAARWARLTDGIATVSQALVENVFQDQGISLTLEDRVNPDNGYLIAELLSSSEGRELVAQTFEKLYIEAYGNPDTPRPHLGTHSDGIVAADADGNVVALVHSINSLLFGMGAFVQGVALNAAASFQQTVIEQFQPFGSRIPDPTAPSITFKNGKPVLASSTIGSGLHEVGFQNLINYIQYGIEPDQSILLPNFLTPEFNLTLLPHIELHYPVDQIVIQGTFNETLLEQVEAMGQGIEELPIGNLGLALAYGFWVGLSIGNATSDVVQLGAASPMLNGYAEGVTSAP